MEQMTIKQFVDSYCAVVNDDNDYRTLVNQYCDKGCIDKFAQKFLSEKEYVAFRALQGMDEDSFKFFLSFEDGYDEDCNTYNLTGGLEDEYITEFDEDVTMYEVFKECMDYMLGCLDNDRMSLLINNYIENE